MATTATEVKVLTPEEKKKKLLKLRQAEGKEYAKQLFLKSYSVLETAMANQSIEPTNYGPALERSLERAVETAVKFENAWKRKKGLFIQDES